MVPSYAGFIIYTLTHKHSHTHKHTETPFVCGGWVSCSVTWKCDSVFFYEIRRSVKSLYEYVEIKCQLDATEVFIEDLIDCSTCFATTMPIIRSSRILYSGCCLWYFALKNVKSSFVSFCGIFVLSLKCCVLSRFGTGCVECPGGRGQWYRYSIYKWRCSELQ